MKQMSMQKAFCEMGSAFDVSIKMRVKFFSHVQKHIDEWNDVKRELLVRCERGDSRICGMGFIDEVRRERKAAGGREFVVNNNWSPYYCRLFALLYPEYRDRFEFRKLKEAA